MAIGAAVLDVCDAAVGRLGRPDLVGDWLSGGLQNNGVLVKLVDGEEDFAVSGPSFPSSRSASTASRPRLTVWYLP